MNMISLTRVFSIPVPIHVDNETAIAKAVVKVNDTEHTKQ